MNGLPGRAFPKFKLPAPVQIFAGIHLSVLGTKVLKGSAMGMEECRKQPASRQIYINLLVFADDGHGEKR